MVSQYNRRLGIEDIWAAGVWTQPLAHARYQAQPGHDLSMLPLLSDVDTDADASSIVRLLLNIVRLPQELRNMIAQHCPESLLYRLASAMRRQRILSSLLDGRAVSEPLCTSIGSWDGKQSLVGAAGQTSYVRLRLDGLGLEQVVDEDSSTATRSSWYVVENIGRFKSSWIELKV